MTRYHAGLSGLRFDFWIFRRAAFKVIVVLRSIVILGVFLDHLLFDWCLFVSFFYVQSMF